MVRPHLVTVVSGLVVTGLLGAALVDAHAPWHLPWVGVAAGALAAAVLGSTLRPARIRPPSPTEADLADAVSIATAAGESVGWLAATGDKALLFDDERRAFLMYGVHRDRWIAFGGPIGPAARRGPLLARFRDLARRAGARIALYEIPADLVPTCVDLGLRSYKFGETAHVPVGDFTLDGKAHKNRRALVNKLGREGVTFEVLEGDAVRAELPALRDVSDAWLREKGAREKGFSLGRFDEAWLVRAPVAVVRAPDDHGRSRIVAFANLLPAGPEVSVDLMRFLPDAPKGTMEYLFVQLLLHTKASGREAFVLGMAPLSGLRPDAGAWSRAGGLVYAHGERFYGFQGLRAFKDKFHPDWAPVYVAVEGRWGLAATLGGVLSLVGGPRAGR